MFTGIVQTVATVTDSKTSTKGVEIVVSPISKGWDCCVGDSIAVGGVCLTLANEIGIDGLGRFVVGPETVAITGLARWQKNNKHNIEPAMRANDRFGGHIVSGHVDGLVEIDTVTSVSDDPAEGMAYSLAVPPQMVAYCIHKGSITIEGISLTINEVKQSYDNDDEFGRVRCNLIPHTLEVTTASTWTPGQHLSVEYDKNVVTIVDTIRAILPGYITELEGTK